MSGYARILVRGPNWLGDLVMATPGFRVLRSAFPDAEIVLHAREAHLPLMTGAPWFDHLLPVRSYHRGALAMHREGRVLRGRRFDLGLCLPDSVSAALLMRLAGVRRLVGYPRVGGGALTDAGPPAPAPMTPRERHVLGLVEFETGRRGSDERVELFVDGQAASRAESLRRTWGLGDRDDLALLAPGASYGPSKCWPPELYAETADRLTAEGLRVAVIGSPDEAPLAAAVEAATRSPVINACGAVDLATLKALIRHARVLVCNDAGARHLAVALGTPSVVLFGPTSVAKTALNLETVRVFASDVGCRPCYHRRCPTDHRCMRGIQPGPVARAALECAGARTAQGEPA